LVIWVSNKRRGKTLITVDGLEVESPLIAKPTMIYRLYVNAKITNEFVSRRLD
tara:strand:- start:314 stop:472 length:159 start_codon:yes stop_codon:yes gene_type:complete